MIASMTPGLMHFPRFRKTLVKSVRAVLDFKMVRTTFRLLGPHIDRQLLREALGYDSVAPLEQFSWDGHDELLYDNANLSPDDHVLVLGGYLGNSSIEWNRRYGCHVLIIEPIDQFAQTIRDKISGNDKLSVLCCAVGASDGQIELSLRGDATGVRSSSVLASETVIVPQQAISTLINLSPKLPILVEINIEGGEYEVLEKIAEMNAFISVRTWLIQWHTGVVGAELRRENIRRFLNETHFEVFNYPFVWERWDRRDCKDKN